MLRARKHSVTRKQQIANIRQVNSIYLRRLKPHYVQLIFYATMLPIEIPHLDCIPYLHLRILC